MKPICRAPMAWTWLFTGFFPSEVRFRPWSSGFSRTEALGTSKGAPTSCQQTMVQPTSGNQPINQPSNAIQARDDVPTFFIVLDDARLAGDDAHVNPGFDSISTQFFRRIMKKAAFFAFCWVTRHLPSDHVQGRNHRPQANHVTFRG